MKEVKQGIAARRHPASINFKQAMKDYAKGLVYAAFFCALILGWQIALAQPVCTHDYKTNITSC